MLYKNRILSLSDLYLTALYFVTDGNEDDDGDESDDEEEEEEEGDESVTPTASPRRIKHTPIEPPSPTTTPDEEKFLHTNFR